MCNLHVSNKGCPSPVFPRLNDCAVRSSKFCCLFEFALRMLQALAQDQLRALRTLVQDGFGPAAPRVDVGSLIPRFT